MVHDGLCLQTISPAPAATFSAGSEVPVRLQVALACGCPTGAGGRYDSRRFQIEAALAREGGEAVSFILAPGSGPGEFAGRIAVEARGDYLLTIEAYDPESGMAGRVKTAFRVR